MNYVALKSEITVDPTTLGYAGKSDQLCADILNLVRPVATISVDRTGIPTEEIVGCFVLAEYTAVSAVNRDWIARICAAPTVRATAAVKAGFIAIFAVGTTTRANLNAVLSRGGTRGEQLGFGMVTPSDIAVARVS